MQQQQQQEEKIMIAPGVRVVRGPDWIWQNQGESLVKHFERDEMFVKREKRAGKGKKEKAEKRDKHVNKFHIISGSNGHSERLSVLLIELCKYLQTLLIPILRVSHE